MTVKENMDGRSRWLTLLVAAPAVFLMLAGTGPGPKGPSRAFALAAERTGPAQVSPSSSPSASDKDRLDAADRDEAAVAFALKTAVGDKVWPGLDSAPIPIILYNSRFEFLLGAAEAPAPWEKVEGDEVDGRPCFRRPAESPQSFAAKVDSVWAGRLTALGAMNARSPIKLTPDQHVVAILHEMFHAFQAEEAPKRFAAALAVYKDEAGYPYGDKAFAAEWNAEGAALAGALKAEGGMEAVALARKFLEIRDARRGEARLGVRQIDFEQGLEWLEGLAEYAEIDFYKLAAGRPGPAPGTRFGKELPWMLKSDFFRLERQLGSQKGDLRFYLSGMAQAFLLDRLDPRWKEQAALNTLVLEDLVRRVALGR
jgi:hypothetical protein